MRSRRPSRIASYLEETVRPQATRFMGPPKEGKLFWDRWLREYYQDRIPVAVDVERLSVWADDRCASVPDTLGTAVAGEPPAQAEPAKGAGPRVDAERAAARLRSLDHLLLAYVGADGYPEVVPVQVEDGGAGGIRITSERPLPPGGRRAGMLAHSYRAKLIGLAARQHTGWLTVDGEGARYAPHTESGFRAPANKTALLLANGLLAKRGLRKARRAAAREQLACPRPRRTCAPRPMPARPSTGRSTPSTPPRSPQCWSRPGARTPMRSASGAPSCCR